MQLHGHLNQITRDGFEFGVDLEQNLDRADASSERIKRVVDDYIARAGLTAPTEPEYKPVWQPQRAQLTLSHRDAGLGSVIWCGGFALDYSFIELPAFDLKGYPKHHRGVVNDVPGAVLSGLAVAAHLGLGQVQWRRPRRESPCREDPRAHPRACATVIQFTQRSGGSADASAS
jgi:putative flavoprotein involved in K+ transport